MPLKLRVYPPSAAQSMARYERNGALTPAQAIAAGLMAGTRDLEDALEALIPEVEDDLRAEYLTVLEGLQIALAAAADDRAEMVAELIATDLLDWERTDSLMAGLRLSLAAEGLDGHVAVLDTAAEILVDLEDAEQLQALAWQRLRGATAELTGPEAPVRLHASAEMRQLLGVSDDVLSLTDLTRLMSARTLDNEPIPGRIYARPSKDRSPSGFFQVVFYPPKPVSLAWAFASPEKRVEIRAAHEAAVEAGMKVVTEFAAWARYGAGSVYRERGEAAWITFAGQHTMSREGDPHLHTHAVLLNAIRSLESPRVGAFDLVKLHGKMHKNGPVAQAYLGELMRGMERLGVDLEMPAPLLAAFQTSHDKAKEAMGPVEGLTERQQSIMMAKAIASTRKPASQAEHGPHDWVQRAIEAVGTEEWQRMAEARGWNWHPRTRLSHPSRQQREAQERHAVGLPEAYHRGGWEADWRVTGR